MKKVLSSDRGISSFRRELFLRRLAVFGLIAIPLAVLSGAGYFICRYDGLRVSSVEVSGNIAVPTDEIISASREMAERSFWGKILGGDHWFAWSSFSGERLRDKVFRLADVSSAIDEERRFRISVSERDESAIWCLVRGEGLKDCFWIDDEGNLFALAPDAEGSLIRVVNDGSGRVLNIKDKALSAAELDNFGKVSGMISEFGWVASDMSFTDAEAKELNVKISSGQELQFSLLSDPSFGRAVIKSLEESGEWPRVDYLDLRVEGKGFYRLK